MKSLVFKTAWKLFKGQVFTSFGEALRAAWAKVKLTARLRAGIAHFSFVKVSTGEVRKAIGTLASAHYQYESKGGTASDKADLVRYWDMEKNGFRSFKIQNLIIR